MVYFTFSREIRVGGSNSERASRSSGRALKFQKRE
jgi:hypothetical protein